MAFFRMLQTGLIAGISANQQVCNVRDQLTPSIDVMLQRVYLVALEIRFRGRWRQNIKDDVYGAEGQQPRSAECEKENMWSIAWRYAVIVSALELRNMQFFRAWPLIISRVNMRKKAGINEA